MLEYLCINHPEDFEVSMDLNLSNWTLFKLKVLIFRHTSNLKGIICVIFIFSISILYNARMPLITGLMDHLTESCPNIEMLLIGRKIRLFPYNTYGGPQHFRNNNCASLMLSAKRFQHLKSLSLVSLNFSNGSCLIPVIHHTIYLLKIKRHK